MPDHVLRADRGVPARDERLVHLGNGRERPVRNVDRAVVAEMRVGGEEYAHLRLLLRRFGHRPSTAAGDKGSERPGVSPSAPGGGRGVAWRMAVQGCVVASVPASYRDGGASIVVAFGGRKVGGKVCSRRGLIYINSHLITCVVPVYLTVGRRELPTTPKNGAFSQLGECKGGNIHGDPKTVLGAAIIRVPRSSNAGMHGDGNRGGG